VVTILQRDHDATLSVRDFGPGLPADRIEQMFQPFGVDHTASTEAGVGLGLAIARLHVEAQGGRLEYASAGEGALFTIRVPVHAPAT
jgi:C4-dicarboxylate-specific signal transduction histidine kinase